MADPTIDELQVLKEFRVKIRDLGLENTSDLYLLRWLRARDLKIPAADELLRKHLKWREEENLDNILDWKAPDNFDKDFNYVITGHDKEGHPICVIPFGGWDVRKIMTSGKKGMREALLRHIDQLLTIILAKMKELSVQFGREITQCIIIVDFANFSMLQLTSVAGVSTLMEAAKRFESNYPETLFQLYVINASRVFQMFFAVMKPLLTARTLGKIEIHTTPDKWRSVLTSRLPKDQLPIAYGGTQAESKLSHCSNGNDGVDRASVDGSQMAVIQIPAGENTKLEFTITTPRSILQWTFKVEGFDIGFSVTLDNEELILTKRYGTEAGAIAGTLLCEQTGEYFLNFDNSYSRLRNKTVSYSVEIIEPTIY